MKTKELKWKRLKNNEVLVGKGFYISYNPHTGKDHNFLTDLGNLLGGDLKDGEETALYLEKRHLWLILEGDFRKEYEAVFSKGLKACEAVYKKHKESKRSNWSTD